MPRILTHPERHLSHRVGWLRAAVLGANDGIVSTASLLMGVAAASGTSTTLLLTTGVAALSAGALSMAVGEYVSVASQRDSEQADIAKERRELEEFPERELDELTGIYVKKGLDESLARQVAVELHKGDQLAVHMAEELGITEHNLARPVQAAATSAGSFAIGAVIPITAIVITPESARLIVIAIVAMIALGGLGALGAQLGGGAKGHATSRVLIGGAAAMALTTIIGRLVGAAI